MMDVNQFLAETKLAAIQNREPDYVEKYLYYEEFIIPYLDLFLENFRKGLF